MIELIVIPNQMNFVNYFQMSLFTSLDNNTSQLKYDPEDLSKLRHSLSLVHNKYSEVYIFLKSINFSQVFQQFRDHDIENLNISLDVCKKWSVTPMELLKNSENPYVFLMFLKS